MTYSYLISIIFKVCSFCRLIVIIYTCKLNMHSDIRKQSNKLYKWPTHNIKYISNSKG